MANDGDEKLSDKIKKDITDDEDLEIGDERDSEDSEESSEGGLFDNLAGKGKDKLQEKIKEGLEKSKDSAKDAANDLEKASQGVNATAKSSDVVNTAGTTSTAEAGAAGTGTGARTAGTTSTAEVGTAGTGAGAGTTGATGTAEAGAAGTGAGAGTTGTTGTAEAGAAGTGAGAGTAGATGTAEAGAAGASSATATAGAAAGGISVGWVVLIIIAVILIIMLIIGFISFFVDGIGLIGGQLKLFADSIWGFFVGQDDVAASEEKIIETAKYLESMGYDLENYGFIDSNGEYIIKEDHEDEGYRSYLRKSDNTEILRKSITKNEDGSITEGDITGIQSKCLKAYLMSQNRIYMLAHKNFNIKGWIEMLTNDTDTSSGVGLVHIDDESLKKILDSDINAETKKLTLQTRDGYKYSYDVDGWTGRYGKSLEFLLTLHMATMAPEFATDVALRKDLESDVRIHLFDVDASIELIYYDENGKYKNLDGAIEVDGNNYVIIKESNYSSLGITDSQWEDIQKYNDDDVKIVTPCIIEVTNHWYRNLDFSKCYGTRENDPDTYEDDYMFTRVYEYVGLGEDDDLLINIPNLYVKEVRKNDVFQMSEPEQIDNSQIIKEMLLGGKEGEENTEEKYKYTIYDGAPLVNEGDTREKRYIIQKLKYNDGTNEDAKVNRYAMDTKMFQYAFAILESTHTQDAEYVLRDLKDLFMELGINVEGEEEEDSNNESKIIESLKLKWLIPDYIPPVWDPMFNSNETMMKIKSAEESGVRGFDEGLTVVMPITGKIVKIYEEESNTKDNSGKNVIDSSETKIIKIEIQDGENDGICITIGGIKLDDSILEGALIEQGAKIGETTKTEISIIMTNKDKTPITNVDDYVYPPDKKDHSNENNEEI